MPNTPDKHARYIRTTPRKRPRRIVYAYILMPAAVAFLLGLLIGRLMPVKADSAPVAASTYVEATVTTEIEPEQPEEDKPAPEDKPEAPEPESLGWFTTYAYCACQRCCGKASDHPAYGITRSGTRAEEGRTIAVDEKVIPLGSRVLIDGHEYVAEDTGSGIRGRMIDIFFERHEDAVQYGRQEAEVWSVAP